MITINIVEDEVDLNRLVKKYLNNEGYHVNSFFSGEECLSSIRNDVDLWILDIMLPGEISGFDLFKMIKNFNSNTPVFFTTARNQEIDRIMGLELGSDDYITKPFSPRELVLRVKNLLKRLNKEVNQVIEYKEYRINLEQRLILEKDNKIILTSKEFDLLKLLIEHRGQPYSRDQLLLIIWETNYFGNDRIVDDLMRRLRKKMPNLDIETIYGYGYRLV